MIFYIYGMQAPSNGLQKPKIMGGGGGDVEAAFTLVELLISISILAVILVMASSLSIQAFLRGRQAALQRRLTVEARFTLDRIVEEVQRNMVDYDEYYNQNVVQGNFGQNFGRYYSAFFHPGTDNKLGFDCADGKLRNDPECRPDRSTLDRNTGAKSGSAFSDADAVPSSTFARQPELYLISKNGFEKTIFAREKIGSGENAAYAISMLKLSGKDTNGDAVADAFLCADGFICGACRAQAGAPNLPRSRVEELDGDPSDSCDSAAIGFAHDFVPISAFELNITDLSFSISPVEDPGYAFSEPDQRYEPKVQIALTAAPNLERTKVSFNIPPISLARTVFKSDMGVIPAPLLVES